MKALVTLVALFPLFAVACSNSDATPASQTPSDNDAGGASLEPRVVSCGPPQVACGGSCVDMATSTAHCGACGNACAQGDSCSAGACACVKPRATCGGACVDLTTSSANCGACGKACPYATGCANGACCAEGSAVCGGACVDVSASSAHCGACNRACATGQTCMRGACSVPLTGTSCADLLARYPMASSGVYSLTIAGESRPMFCDMTTDGGGWTLAAKFSAGVVGDDASAIWDGGARNDTKPNLLWPATREAVHYVSRIPERWNMPAPGFAVAAARVHVYQAGAVARFFGFSRIATSTNRSWFAIGTMSSSSFVDIVGGLNYFSIAGDAPAGRRWFINAAYQGNCENDGGWLVVTDAQTAPCAWDRGRYGSSGLRILFSNEESDGQLYGNQWTPAVTLSALPGFTPVGEADTLAIFVR